MTNHRTGKPVEKATKNKFVFAYDKYATIQNIQWEKPRYRVEEKTPLIPTTQNIEAIIANASPRYTTIFKILKETGASGKELHDVARKDIDTEQGIISITGVKGHASGTYRLTAQTAEMLRIYLHSHPQEDPFPAAERMGDVWRKTRRRTAKKLCKPELDNILLKALRNYSGAHLYYKTQDPIAVMRHLRHKKLETTMHYIRGITIGGEEEYTCKTATNAKEAMQLIEAGFQYVTEMDGLKLFRKRK